MVHCLFSVKHSEGLSHVGSTKEVQETFPCLTGITNVLRSNLLCATFRIFTLPFQFSFEYAFLHYYRGSLPGQKKIENFQVFCSTSITVTSSNNWKTSFELGESCLVSPVWSNGKEKLHVPYLAEKTCLKKIKIQDPVKIDELYRTVNCHCSQVSY